MKKTLPYLLIILIALLSTEKLTSCTVDAGTYNVDIVGSSLNFNLPGNHIALCINDHFNITSNLDYDLADVPSNCPSCTPQMTYLVYKEGGPTVSNPENDPNWNSVSFIIYGDGSHLQYSYGPPISGLVKNNNGANSFINSWVPQAGATWCFVPFTIDHSSSQGAANDLDYDNDGCYELGEPLFVTYLNPITFSEVQKCDATVEVTIKGGYPEFFSGNYTLVNTGAGSLSSTQVNSHGETIVISGLLPGDVYSFEITDQNGCPATFSGASSYEGLPDASITPLELQCLSSGLQSLTVNTGGGVFSGTGVSGSSFNPSAAGCGIHQVFYEVSNSTCTNIDSIQVRVACASIDSVQVSEPFCYSGTNGSIKVFDADADSVKFNGGSTWQPLGITTYNGLPAGNYVVVVKDSMGCSFDTMEITIDQPQQINIQPDVDQITCLGADDGEITLVVSGGTPGFDYMWSHDGNLNDSILVDLEPGDYEVTVQDIYGCQMIEEVTIDEPAQALTASLDVTQISCYNNDDGEITVDVSGGESPYNYQWSNGETTATISDLEADVYNLTLTDNRGCIINNLSAEITNPSAPLVISPISDSVSCYGGNDGSVTVLVSGGEKPYDFLWDINGQSETDSLIQDLEIGSYSVDVTDSRGCEQNVQITLEQPDSLKLNVGFTNVACKGDSTGFINVTVSGGTAPYSYEWSGYASDQTTSFAENLPPGTYYCTVQDSKGCEKVIERQIKEPNVKMQVLPNVDSTSCYGGTDGNANVIVLGGVSPYIYTWDNAAGNQTTDTAYNLPAGIYHVTVMDAWGCEIDTTGPVIEPDPAVIDILFDSVSCLNGNDGKGIVVPISGITPFSYQWDNNANNQTDSIAIGLVAGTYYVSIYEATGCEYDTFITVLEPDTMFVSLDVTQPTCPENNGVLTAYGAGSNGGFTYLWSANTGSATTQTVNNLADDSYGVTVTDQKGCTVDTIIDLNPIVLLQPNEAIDSVSCFGLEDGKIELNPSNGNPSFSYQWTSNVVSTEAGGRIATHLAADDYGVTVTDIDGCVFDTLFTVYEPELLVASANLLSNTTCYDTCNGSAAVQAQGGTQPYVYGWSAAGSSAQSATVITLCDGMNYVTVTDHKGCTSIDSVNISQPSQLTINLITVYPTCFNVDNGNIIAVVSGGTSSGTYHYEWNYNGAITPNIANLPGGNYDVTATDDNGCEIVGDTFLIAPDSIRIYTSQFPSTCHRFDGLAIIDSVNGGGGSFSYEWDVEANAQITDTAFNLTDGCYVVTVMDNVGCMNTAEVCVGLIPGPEVDYIVGDAVTCHGYADGTAEVSVMSGTDPITFEWSNMENTSSIENLSSGWYFVTASDANNCEAIDSVEVISPPEVSVIASSDDAIMCLDGVNTLNAEAFGGNGGAFTYAWNNGESSASFQTVIGLDSLFFVIAYDVNNCPSKADTIEMFFYPPTEVSVEGASQICSNQNIELEAVLTGGTGGSFQYQWSNTATTQSIVDAPNYPVSTMYYVTASSGCEDVVDSIEISYFLNPVFNVSASTTFGCPPLEVTFESNTQNVLSCSWDFGSAGSNNISCSPTALFETEGCQDVTYEITTNDGCVLDTVYSCMIETAVRPQANFYFTPDSATVMDPRIQLYDSTIADTTIVSWQWYLNDEYVTAMDFEYTFPNLEGAYPVELIVTDANSCTDTALKLVKITPVFNVYSPNTFTPDDNGVNDYFAPVVDGLDDSYELRVYDRWGNLVFESFRYEDQWDGKSGDKVFPQGVYIWKMTARSKVDHRYYQFEGVITLLRTQ